MVITVVQDPEVVADLAGLFSLLGDPTRLKIVLVCLKEPISVGDIAERLELAQSLVSHHLRLLRTARILKAERRGRHMFYSPLDRHVEHVIEDMLAHVIEPQQ
jgi:DNA-binding transcriptional ArsR family regulator